MNWVKMQSLKAFVAVVLVSSCSPRPIDVQSMTVVLSKADDAHTVSFIVDGQRKTVFRDGLHLAAPMAVITLLFANEMEPHRELGQAALKVDGRAEWSEVLSLTSEVAWAGNGFQLTYGNTPLVTARYMHGAHFPLHMEGIHTLCVADAVLVGEDSSVSARVSLPAVTLLRRRTGRADWVRRSVDIKRYADWLEQVSYPIWPDCEFDLVMAYGDLPAQRVLEVAEAQFGLTGDRYTMVEVLEPSLTFPVDAAAGLAE